MIEFIVGPFPVNTHSFRWQDLRPSPVCHQHPFWYFLLLLYHMIPLSHRNDTFSAQYVLCPTTLVFFSCFSFLLKGPAPFFLPGWSFWTQLEGTAQAPFIDFCLSQTRRISSLLWPSMLIIHTHLAITKSTRQYLCYFICVSSPGPSFKFLEGRGHRSFFFFPYVAIFPYIFAKRLPCEGWGYNQGPRSPVILICQFYFF